MKLIYRGRYAGADQLPRADLPPSAVRFREPEDTAALNRAAIKWCLLALAAAVVLGAATIPLRGGLELGFGFRVTAGCAASFLTLLPHELLHGLGWTLAGGRGWGPVRFNISALMPSCSYTAPLARGQYIAGVLAPFVLLGGGSAIFMFVYPGTISVLTMIVNFLLAGADLLIAFKALRGRGELIVDHPTKAGYVIFVKQPSVKE